ncbi:hypothetical protein VTL71DRAFT_15725 [Oculimacula yallundae]|uniref:Uncharacterized protein n=1 Tax=Oculimacula yallundae TaxID=86028 RepID=A0ABR4CCF8_9HELO
MQFHFLFAAAVGTLSSLAQAKPTCQPSPAVTPKPQYEFTMNLKLGAGTNVGVDIYNERQTYLPVTGGKFCAKWNGGVTGSVVSGVANFYQTANGTGPYRLDFEYLIKTSDTPPASFVVKQSGWEVNRVGRTTYSFATGDSRYSFVNSGVYIGVEVGYVVNGTTTHSAVDGYTLV